MTFASSQHAFEVLLSVDHHFQTGVLDEEGCDLLELTTGPRSLGDTRPQLALGLAFRRLLHGFALNLKPLLVGKFKVVPTVGGLLEQRFGVGDLGFLIDKTPDCLFYQVVSSMKLALVKLFSNRLLELLTKFDGDRHNTMFRSSQSGFRSMMNT